MPLFAPFEKLPEERFGVILADGIRGHRRRGLVHTLPMGDQVGLGEQLRSGFLEGIHTEVHPFKARFRIEKQGVIGLTIMKLPPGYPTGVSPRLDVPFDHRFKCFSIGGPF